jgi:hypothetical protein
MRRESVIGAKKEDDSPNDKAQSHQATIREKRTLGYTVISATLIQGGTGSPVGSEEAN